MTNISRQIIEKFEIRKSKKQKEAFRAWLQQQLTAAGYESHMEGAKGLWRSHNIVVGNPDKAKVLLTAHYDTCAVLPFPNFITPRNLFWYLAYQLVIVAVILGAELVTVWVVALIMERIIGAVLGALFGGIAGYAVLIFCLWWMMDGKANRHTANDNTSGVITLLEIALSLPEDLRKDVCFVWFDNEERGLLGSKAFAKRHREAQKKALVINFDCVSDGDSIQLFPTKKVKKSDQMDALRRSFLSAGEKSAEVVAGFGFYPSDQAAFVHGVGVCALKKSKIFGWYMDRIHTGRDTVLDEVNIDLLRAGAVRLLQTMNEKEETHV